MKPKHYCPSCHQEFSRKWNMERHVKDQHSTQDKLFFDYSPMTNARKRSPILGEPSALNGISDYIKTTDEVIQIYNKYTQQHAKVHSQATPGYSPFPNYPYFNPYPPVSEQNVNDSPAIIGFKAMICESCLITITIPIFKREDSDKIKLEHSCDPNRIIEVQHLDKKQYLNRLHEQLPQMFLASYRAQVSGTIYLTAVRCQIPNGISANGTIDLANIRQDHWAVKAITEYKIIPSDNELLDFLRMVGSESPAILNIYNSSSAGSSSHYLFAMYPKPLLI